MGKENLAGVFKVSLYPLGQLIKPGGNLHEACSVTRSTYAGNAVDTQSCSAVPGKTQKDRQLVFDAVIGFYLQ